MRLAPETRLGPYEVIAPLAAGGMGEVYRARDTRLGREVAVKVLPVAASSDPERLHRFEQEARAASALNHPNIMAVHDAGIHEGVPYVVSELLEGETLHERMRGGALPPARAALYASQVAKGLAAAHEKGIIHRDLKPENLFLTRDDHVKILDFGLAKLEGPLTLEEGVTGPLFTSGTSRPATTAGTIMGTVGYLSPEQIRGQALDGRSDLFSLGVILYEMLAGRAPFRRDTAVEGLHATLKEEPPWLSQVSDGIPPALEQVVLRCLEKEPDRRFQSARDLAFHLESLSGATARMTGTVTVPRRRSRRSLLPFVGVLALAVALGAAFLAGRRSRPSSAPPFQQLTFRRGTIHAARFAPDGQTIVYGAGWEGNPVELFSTRPESPESRALEPRAANILSISSKGEMALLLLRGRVFARGTLARAPLAGGAPREMLEDVEWADWAPDGERLAVVRGGAAGKRLEFPIGTVLYETPGWISHLRVSPRGDSVAFLDHPVPGDNGGSVAVVDASRKVRTLSAGWGGVWGLAWPPSGEVWFTAAERGGHHALYSVDLSGRRRLLTQVPLRMVLQDVSRDGRRILVTDDRLRRSTVGQPPGETQERDLSWYDYSNLRDLSADGRMMLFTEDGRAGGTGVYLRGTDGSPAVRLGEGKATALSPDGKWVLVVQSAPPRLVALPTGAGESRELLRGGFERCEWANFFPDGNRIVAVANERGRRARLYVQDGAGKPLRAISGEGVGAGFGGLAVSPDGAVVAALGPDGKAALFRTDGAGSLPMPGVEPGEVPVQWSRDGASLYVVQPGALPSTLVGVERATGRRSLWRQLVPTDPSGVLGVNRVRMTPDATAYVYTFSRILSDLFLAEGLE